MKQELSFFLILASLSYSAFARPTGSIIGHVFFDGKPPSRTLVSMAKEPFCAQTQKKIKQREETIVVNLDHTLRFVVVFIKRGLHPARYKTPPPVVLDQYNCWYRPHVLAVMTGQTIKVINDDPGVDHNLHFMSKKNPPLNFGEPGESSAGKIPSRLIRFRYPEIIPVQCDVHPWMQGVIRVISNPYFCVTGTDGSFAIPNLPPGDYVIEAWHEKLGTQTAHVHVGPHTKELVNFHFRKN